MAAILILDNFGINVSTLVAGLGIGGIAIALAVQKILGDLICSISILLDKPFEVGDFIVIGDMMGSVAHIGVKSTRIKSLGGEQIVVPNSDLVAGRIQNFKRMEDRRVVFVVRCTYNTPLDLVEKVPVILKESILSCSGIRFDRAHFRGYGGTGLEFEAVYYVLTGDYNRYMDIQQSINLAIMRRFLELGIKFPSA